jgi:hypothetical protein
VVLKVVTLHAALLTLPARVGQITVVGLLIVGLPVVVGGLSVAVVGLSVGRGGGGGPESEIGSGIGIGDGIGIGGLTKPLLD